MNSSALSQPASTTRHALALIIPLWRRYWLKIAGGVLALMAVDLCQLFIPRVIKASIDSLSAGESSRALLLRQGMTIVALAVAIAVFRFVWRNLILGVSRRLERDLRKRFFAHLLTLDRAFFQRHPAGELMALSSNDLTAVQMAAGMGLISLIDSVVMTGAVLVFMLYINPHLTLIALSPLPALALLTKLLSSRLHQSFTTVQETFSRLTEQARSAINAIRLVKIAVREDDWAARFDRTGRDYVNCSLKVAAIQGLLFPVSGLVANISLLLVVVVGGRLAVGGAITIGDLVAFISYLFIMIWPMMAIGWVVNLFQRGLTSLSRLEAVFEARPAMIRRGGLSCPRKIEALELQGLTFTYPDESRPVLTGITLSLRPGILGLIGPTGAGKSSLCHLLAQIYPAPEGTILVNGGDINRLDLDSYRQQVAYAPQEPFLFADSIAANIAFGRPGARAEEIEGAARAVGLHEEIMAFATGYQSKIGERGVTLSGGQRQRLSLARALITRVPILIIDDGLSAVDGGAERLIIAAIADYAAQGRLVLMVSHRLAQLTGADRIAVLKAGRISGLGTAAELLADNDYFQAVYRAQSEPAGAAGKGEAAHAA